MNESNRKNENKPQISLIPRIAQLISAKKTIKKSTHGNNIVTYVDKKISHDVTIKFSRKFHRNVVR